MAKLVEGVNDLGTINPELSAQWNFQRNGNLTPQDVTAGSGKNVWWVCSLGHEWEAKICNRSNGRGCPYCSGNLLLCGFNDLATVNSHVAAQWHPTRNERLTPQNFTAGSGKKVWWLCAFNHEWEAKICQRSSGSGCPYCVGLLPISGVNDLATLNPDVASQWHPTLNKTLKPQDFTVNSGKKVWWLCCSGHEWEAVICNRSNGRGCPFCSSKRVLIGFNDLATLSPDIASQWHPTKNGKLTPLSVSVKSQRKVWWQCSLTHVWEATIASRSAGGNGCPYCSGRLSIVGSTDLATKNPDLASQWHPTKNGNLRPKDVTPGSEKKAWWICALNHVWRATITSRTRGNGCPYCSGLLPLVGSTDLATKNPDLASQWHPTKNGNLTPQNVTPGSEKKVWWICAFEHEWEALISNRFRGAGCPKCSVGLTERTFRAAFKKISGLDFEANRIHLVRSSRKYSRAQIDMLNDDLKLAIEYDGEFTHGENKLYKNTLEQRLEEDKETTQALVGIGYNVIRIREHGNKGMLPFVPLDPEYESNVFQITYKSFGKDKDDIDVLAEEIIATKAHWFVSPSHSIQENQ